MDAVTFERLKNIGFVTPWCSSFVVGDRRTWFYQEARWSNGITYSALDNPEFGKGLKERSQKYDEAPQITNKMYVQELPWDWKKLKVGQRVTTVCGEEKAVGQIKEEATLESKCYGKDKGLVLTFKKNTAIFNFVNRKECQLIGKYELDHGQWGMQKYSAGIEEDEVTIVKI